MAKKDLTVTLYLSELLYDIQNKTYLTGRSRHTETNHEAVAHMQANDDEENENQILRSIGNAFSVLKTQLSEYIEETTTSSTNELLSKDDELKLTLIMPSNYNQATSDSVSAATHQFVVNTAIGDWFNITNKNDAADYVALASMNLEELRKAASKRVRPVRAGVN